MALFLIPDLIVSTDGTLLRAGAIPDIFNYTVDLS